MASNTPVDPIEQAIRIGLIPDENGMSPDSMRGSEHHIRHRDINARGTLESTGGDRRRDDLSTIERMTLENSGAIKRPQARDRDSEMPLQDRPQYPEYDVDVNRNTSSDAPQLARPGQSYARATDPPSESPPLPFGTPTTGLSPVSNAPDTAFNVGDESHDH